MHFGKYHQVVQAKRWCNHCGYLTMAKTLPHRVCLGDQIKQKVPGAVEKMFTTKQ